jgi:hypothetical protein
LKRWLEGYGNSIAAQDAGEGFCGNDGKLVERLVGAPDDVREIEAGLERRVNWLLAS